MAIPQKKKMVRRVDRVSNSILMKVMSRLKIGEETEAIPENNEITNPLTIISGFAII